MFGKFNGTHSTVEQQLMSDVADEPLVATEQQWLLSCKALQW
jgi:hypothetical protein